MKIADNKHRFLSIYGSGYITDSQYLTEQLCAHVARRTQEDLIDHFWKLPKWQKFFKEQIPAACQLLKYFDLKSIILAIKDKRCAKMYSLRAKWFIAIVREYKLKQDLIDAQPKQLTQPVENAENTLPRQPYGQETILNRLQYGKRTIKRDH